MHKPLDSWETLLESPVAGDHVVQIYEEESFLVEAVGHYLQAGLKRGEMAIVIATKPHREGFVKYLSQAGINTSNGNLVLLDARDTLASFMSNGIMDAGRFREVVGERIQKAHRQTGRKVCAYGEMVDLLFQDGQRDEANELEGLWNKLAKTHEFSLLCAYRLGSFEVQACGAMTDISRAHTHLIPVRDYLRLERALDMALKEVIGEEGGIFRAMLAAFDADGTRMPPAQTALLWLRQTIPTLADQVLARTGEIYKSLSPACTHA